MQHDRIAYFVDRYSGMTDEELAHLRVTRRDSLCDEAREALQRVINGRWPSRFQQEMRATEDDISAQAENEERVLRRQREHHRELQRRKRVLFFVLGTALILGGLAAATFGKNLVEGLLVAGFGLAMSVYLVLRSLIARFVIALFRSDSTT